MTAYHRLRLLVPTDLEEAVTGELWARGAMGCAIGDLSLEEPRDVIPVEAWFPDPLPEAASTLDERWKQLGVEVEARERVEEQDWLEPYRESARPFPLGRLFLVDPRDVDTADEAPSEDGRKTLRIPAQTAFGTGSHATTRLLVAWLEDLDVAEQEVLDVGTGSGILAFAALHLGARRAVGFDLDPASPCIAIQNAALNEVSDFFAYAGTIRALSSTRTFDLVLVNVLPERIAEDLPAVVASVKAGGRLLSSGNLWRRREEIARRFEALGLRLEETRRDSEEDDWAAFLWSKP